MSIVNYICDALIFDGLFFFFFCYWITLSVRASGFVVHAAPLLVCALTRVPKLVVHEPRLVVRPSSALSRVQA